MPSLPTLTERKIALNGNILEFPLERWLVSPDLIVGRWVADQDPRAAARYPGAAGYTSWGVWWPARPYSAYRLHRPDGSLRGYRLDTIAQARCDGETVEFHDLLLDALIRPSGEVRIEDEDEVAEAISAGALSLNQQWRITWTKHFYQAETKLLLRRIDDAIAQAQQAQQAQQAGSG